MNKGFCEGIEVKSEKPYVLVSPSWGLVGDYYSQEQATGAMLAGVRVPVKRFQLGEGQLVQNATLYHWSVTKKVWVAKKVMKVEQTA